MIKKAFGYVMVVSAVAFTSVTALASGSGGGGYGSGGGGYGSGGGSYPAPSAPRDPFADAYARGKSHFKKQITCKKCEFPQGVHDSMTAEKVAKRIKAGEFAFNAKQRQDVMIFLQKRYGVTV
jgi:hypothetical protein